MTSEEMRRQVEQARNVQLARFKNQEIRTNSQMKIADLSLYCTLDDAGAKFMENAYQAFSLTARGYHRVMKVARTIADLAGSEQIKADHLREAVGYRMIDQKYWRR